MAIMAPELAEAAGEAVGAGKGAAGAGRAAGARAQARGRHARQAVGRAAKANTAGGSDLVGSHAASQGTGEQAARRAQQYGVQQAQELPGRYGRGARDVITTGNLTGGRSSHQGAILAEFVVAIALVSLAPIASDNTGTGTGVSPFQANDLKRLVLIGVVYFGLALVPGDNGSKVAAWLGFLVLLALAMGMMSTGALNSVLGIFSPGGTAPPGSTAGSDTGTTGGSGAAAAA